MLGVNRNPNAITIGQDMLYWTDWHQNMLLGLPKNTTGGGVEPNVLQKYQKDVNDLVSNSLFLNIDTKECPALSPFTEKVRMIYILFLAMDRKVPWLAFDSIRHFFEHSKSSLFVIILFLRRGKSNIFFLPGFYSNFRSLHSYIPP